MEEASAIGGATLATYHRHKSSELFDSGSMLLLPFFALVVRL